MNATDIITILDELSARCGIAIDWTAENVMPYLEQFMEKYIRYTVAINLSGMMLVLMLTVASLIVCIKMYPNAKKEYWNPSVPTVLFIVGSIMCCVFGILFCMQLFINGKILIECWTFPEKVIFDYLKTIQ